MTPEKLIASLEAQGFSISVEGKNLVIVPEVSSEILESLRIHKAGILEILLTRETYSTFARLLPLLDESSEEYKALVSAYDESPADGSFPLALARRIVETFKALDPGFENFLLTSRYRKAA